MFRDERDALSAQVESLEQRLNETKEQLQKTQEELKEAKEGPAIPFRTKVFQFCAALFAAWVLVCFGYLLYIITKPSAPTTFSTRTLVWRAKVLNANGPYPAPETACSVILNLSQSVTPAETLFPKELIEVTRWQIECGDQVVTINDQKLKVIFFAEEHTAEDTYRYHINAGIRFEKDSSLVIDTDSKTVRLSRPGYGLFELGLGGPSEPQSGVPLRQPWVPSPE